MKTKLERINERLIELRDQAHDDELTDELDNAILHVEAAVDRIVQMEEEEDEENLSGWERASAIALADELLNAIAQSSQYEDLENCSPDNDPD